MLVVAKEFYGLYFFIGCPTPTAVGLGDPPPPLCPSLTRRTGGARLTRATRPVLWLNKTKQRQETCASSLA